MSKLPLKWATWLELTRFGLLGLKANAIYFAIYVLMTMAGLDPLLVVVTIFVFGAVYSFWLNKFLVFRNAESSKYQFFQYLALYSVVCALNVGALHFAVSRLAMNHFVAQGILVCVLALVLFLAQKYLIFGEAQGPQVSSTSHNGCSQPGTKL